MKRTFILALLPIIIASAATAAEGPFMYSGKPIDAICFYNFHGKSDTIQLGTCGARFEKLVRAGQNAELVKQGFVGYRFEDVGEDSRGFSYYKTFPGGNNLYWVYTVNDGGGSGVFTAINAVSRTGEATLKINNIAMGDRCNGGIQDVEEKNHQLMFSVNITPYDLLLLNDKSAPHAAPYRDLPACATCCTGKAFYTVDSSLQAKMTHITLNAQSVIPDNTDPKTFAGCFNKIYKTYMSKGQAELDGQQVEALTQKIQEECEAPKG